MWRCMMMGAIGCAVLNILIRCFEHFFLSFFTTSPDVLQFAYIRIEYVLLFQFIATSYEISGAAMRGLGYSMTPTMLTILGTCVVRLIWVYMFFHSALISTFSELLTIYPITWALTGVAVLGAYFIVRKRAYAKLMRQ